MKWILLVALAGLLAAAPFLSSRALGTSEAYNYSLAVADAAKQARNGVWPVLAGQTEFAFNGRVHPLRTAPYLTACACAIDLVTFRQLEYRTLQNLALALSLLAGALACYWALRRVTPVDPPTAALLASAYILSPGVLSTVYAMDLYMTVMTVPYVPLVLAANLLQFQRRSFAGFAGLAAALAACWLAHPPVAMWLSLATGALQLLAFFRQRPAWRDLPLVAGAGLLFLLLAGFGFASALAISSYGDITHARDVTELLKEVQRVFAASLRPVSAQANLLSDFQLGYVAWAGAGIALVLAALRRNLAALALLLVAAGFFVLTAPVPGLNRWLWEQAPTFVINLTNQWPMQRLYLPMTALVIFAFALVWRRPAVSFPLLRDALRLALALAVGWTLWQAWRFIGRGYDTRQSPAASVQGHLSSNINLTGISYALLGTPRDFVHGTVSPQFGFRLLAPFDLHEAASNWTAPLPASPENRSGQMTASPGDSPDILDLAETFLLQPGTQYRLTFRFLVPPGAAVLQVRGSTLFREYSLPAAGGPRGFGMNPDHNPRLVLWTDQSVPESIQLRLVGPGLAGGPWRGRSFAEFTFERIDPAALPVELQSLLPLRARVRATAAGYLETPRAFTAGYVATVDGRPVRLQRSPEGMVMLPVPAGESLVEVRYPGPSAVRWAFLLSSLAWAGVAVWGGLRWGPARLRLWAERPAHAIGRRLRAAVAGVPRRRWLAAAGFVGLCLGAVPAWRAWDEYRNAVGPVRIRFVLPQGGTNRQQPLLVTGQPHAGTFVYAVYVDPAHIKIGFDVWSVAAFETEPIKVDYFAEHEVVIDSGALYPPDHPALRGLPAETLGRLRNHLRIELDGRTVVEREVDPFASRVRDVTVGLNRIGGSTCEPRFAGEILRVERLPVPARPR